MNADLPRRRLCINAAKKAQLRLPCLTLLVWTCLTCTKHYSDEMETKYTLNYDPYCANQQLMQKATVIVLFIYIFSF